MLGGLENPLHIILILVVVLMLFGAKRLPEMGKSLGTGLRGFKESLSGHESHDSEDTSADAPTPALTEASDPVAPGHALDGASHGELREVVRAVR